MKLLTLLIVLSGPTLALADEAEDHLAKGTRSYNIQDWPNALKEYRQAYTLDPKPDTLWAIAQTQRLSGDCRGAIMTYKSYMRGASPAGANAASDLIKQCESDLSAQQRAVDAAAEPKPAPVVVTPEPPKPVETKPKAPRPWVLDPLGDTLFIIGVGGLAVGGTFLVRGNLEMGDATDAATSGDYDTRTRDARTDQKIGVAATVGGAVFTGLAVWRFIAVHGRHPSSPTSEKPSQAFDVVPMRDGALASYLTRF